ncbi:MAG: flavin reductase family protein [Chloroflexi bacterium]|nr:MAG: flavin reductase family protein [Chloroflexota bacterium]
MIINPQELDRVARYKLMIGAIVPRPIAWVSTMSADGRLNLAPFSYFTAVCPQPMTLVFCPGVHPDGRKKDTWLNIEEVPEFVIHITNEETAEAMNLSATVLPRGESEFEWAGVTPVSSQVVRVPRVAEAPIAFECRLQQIVVVSEQVGGGAAVFGEVQCIHVRDDLYENGRILLDRLHPIGRLAGSGYTRITDTFEMHRVPPPAQNNSSG